MNALKKNIFKTILTALLFMLALCVTGTPTEAAKKKAYKTKTIKVTKGKTKTVKTSKKIKKVKISSKNKKFNEYN